MRARLFLVCMISCNCVFAQSQVDYRPFVQQDKNWEIQVGLIMENDYCYHIMGDTLIDGENWKKVYNTAAWFFMRDSYYAAVCEKGKKVYAIAKGSTRPRLLYDFGLKEGETVWCGIESNDFCCLLDKDEAPDNLLGFPFNAYLKVEKIDTIEARGKEFRRFSLAMYDYFWEPMRMVGSIVWVEGVGSGAGPFSPWLPIPPEESKSLFIDCTDPGRFVFGYSDFYQGSMPAAVSTTHSSKTGPNIVHDLLGRRLRGKPARGIYIQDGRKVVAE